jgi:acyl-CoA synthetase (AMP-forming)/AMP-acid ligase II
MLPLGEAATRADTVGRALPCADVIAMDDDGRAVAPGASGELWIAGPMIIPGYWQNPEADQTAFCGGYWKSGDIGSVDAEGYVRVLDRKKDLINRGGYKVYCIEVESVLARHPGVVEVAVIGRPDPVLGERVHAVVVARNASIGEAELKRFCAENLSDYKVPDTIAFLPDALPRNANGKVQKTALRETVPPRRSPA